MRRNAMLALIVISASLFNAFATEHASADATEFVAGGATANASSLGLSIHQGNGNVGLTVGSSEASYRDNYSSATAKPLDLQLLKILLGESSKCPGSTEVVPLPDSSLPLELQSNSLQSDVGTLVSKDAMLPGFAGAPSPGVAGHGTTLAGAKSSAKATTSNPTQDLIVISLVSPSTSVEVSLNGTVRTATASSTAERLVVLGGLMTVEHPTWTATTSSGSTVASTGTFTTTGGTLFGFQRSPDESIADLKGFANLLHDALGFVGVGLDLPTVTSTAAGVSVSPLRLHLSESPLGKSVLSPLMSAPLFGTLPSIDSILKDSLDNAAAQNCSNKRLRQIADILLQVIRGNGEIELPIGGVSVTTDATPPPAGTIDLGGASELPTTTSTYVAPEVSPSFDSADPLPLDSSVAGAEVSRFDEVVVEDSAPVVPEPAPTSNPSASGPSADPGVINFAKPLSATTREIPGKKGGPLIAIGFVLAALAACGFGVERSLNRRRLIEESA